MPIKPCVCQSAFQDAMYGKGRRVANKNVSPSGAVGYRCTVCGKDIVESHKQSKASKPPKK